MFLYEAKQLNTAGIYIITNKVNNKVYIGQAKNIWKRIQCHISACNCPTKKDYNVPIHVAIRKYGIENFSLDLVEACDVDQLNDREIYWIDYYKSYDDGYNATRGGKQNIRFIKLTKADVIKIRTELLTTKQSNELIAKKYNVCTDLVYRINIGTAWHDNNYKYPLRDPQYYRRLGNYRYDGYCYAQYDMAGNLVRRFTKPKPAATALGHPDWRHHISAAALRNNQKFGYIWKKEEISEEDYYKLLEADWNLIFSETSINNIV